MNPAFLVLAVTFVLLVVWLVVERWLERRWVTRNLPVRGCRRGR
jgi:hypothetical protein